MQLPGSEIANIKMQLSTRAREGRGEEKISNDEPQQLGLRFCGSSYVDAVVMRFIPTHAEVTTKLMGDDFHAAQITATQFNCRLHCPPDEGRAVQASRYTS